MTPLHLGSNLHDDVNMTRSQISHGADVAARDARAGLPSSPTGNKRHFDIPFRRMGQAASSAPAE
jgi:hypothetical protein